jgi:uncharacterized membrane protein
LQGLLAAVEASALAEHLRFARVSYPLVNAAHIVGIAMLFGAILPLDLRLLGLFPTTPLAVLARVLRPVAAAGFVLAAATGLTLFSVQATDYAATPLFGLKMTLVALGLANALALTGPRLAAAPPARLRAAGAASLALWLAAILAGRWLGYLD